MSPIVDSDKITCSPMPSHLMIKFAISDGVMSEVEGYSTVKQEVALVKWCQRHKWESTELIRDLPTFCIDLARDQC